MTLYKIRNKVTGLWADEGGIWSNIGKTWKRKGDVTNHLNCNFPYLEWYNYYLQFHQDDPLRLEALKTSKANKIKKWFEDYKDAEIVEVEFMIRDGTEINVMDYFAALEPKLQTRKTFYKLLEEYDEL